MKVLPRILPIIAAALFAVGTLNAQTSTYAIGQEICGPVSTNIYCYGIPVTLAGAGPASFWLDSGPTAHFILFSGGLDHLGTVQINQDASYQPTVGAVHYTTPDGKHWSGNQITSLSLTYYGTDANGQAVNGAMTVSFDYYYSDRCSGRGCHTGWYRRVTGGSTTFTVTEGY